jgi:hypothetical protein
MGRYKETRRELAIDYFLACFDCNEFVSLHKWCPDRSQCYPAREPSIFPEQQSYQAVWLTPEHILQQVGEDQDYFQAIDPGHWALKLLPVVSAFCDCHGTHRLISLNDDGDLPWHPAEAGFAVWRDATGPKGFYSQFLPRNLVEDEGLSSAEEALAHVRTQERWVLDKESDITEYVQAFEVAKARHLQKAA